MNIVGLFAVLLYGLAFVVCGTFIGFDMHKSGYYAPFVKHKIKKKNNKKEEIR